MSEYIFIRSATLLARSEASAISQAKQICRNEINKFDNNCQAVEIIKRDGLNETVIYGESCSRCENNTKHLGIVECLECPHHYTSKTS